MTAFVHAWFRSGSTWLWEKFREDDSFLAFYEPLHEDLPNWTPERIRLPHAMPFDGANHPSLNRSYYYEYLPLVEEAKLNFNPSVSYQSYFLKEDDSAPELQSYLDGLIGHARLAGKRPALCFCRSAMRARWMKQRFGGVHIAQIRNPFDQWRSFRKNSYFVNRMVMTGLFVEKNQNGAFRSIPGFRDLFEAWLAGKGVSVNDDQCTLIFIHMWLYSAIQSIAASEIVVDIDRLSDSADTLKAVSSAMRDQALPFDLSDCQAPRSDRDTREYQVFNDRFLKVIEALLPGREVNQHLIGFDTIEAKLDFLAPNTGELLSRIYRA
jgi:hypothetical protein